MIDGEPERKFGLIFNAIEGTALEKINYSFFTAMNYVRMIRVSLAMLFSGAAGVSDLAGPVAIVSAMNTIGQESRSVGAALGNIADFAAFIGVNIALINLLPIPAMDGGRILFLFITWAIEKVIRRRLNPKYEGYIHTVALVLLMGFMAFVLVNDVLRIING